MKKSLLFKLILCYFICVFCFFVLFNTVGSGVVTELLYESRTQQLKETGDSIVESFESKNIDTMTSEQVQTEMDRISSQLHAVVFVYSNDRKVSFTSGPKKSFQETRVSYSATFSSEKYGKVYFDMYLDNSCIDLEYSNLMTFGNIALIALSVIVLLIFILVYFLTIYPLHKINVAAKEYSKGNFSYELKIGQNDEYRDLGNTIKYMANELNNLDDYQRKFIGNISHDFRSPLTSIKGYITAMIDGTIPVEKQEKYLGIILFEADRLSGLMSSLLTLYNFDNNKGLLNKNSFDINYIMKKTAETYEGACDKKKISFVYRIGNEPLMVYADQPKIQQVINNLIDNAIKFSPHYSRIILSTYVKGDKVFVSVKDFGEGIPKDSINRIWERFYKNDPSRGKDKKGTGLGLAITKEIIQAHNENIDVISTEGVGSEFIFTLPKDKNKTE